MSNYSIQRLPRGESNVTLHDLLHLTSCEVNVHVMAPSTAYPCVYSHKENEVVYMVLDGSGLMYVDEEVIPLGKGHVVRVDPEGCRCFKSGLDGMRLLAIEARKGSLTSFGYDDTVSCDEKAFDRYTKHA